MKETLPFTVAASILLATWCPRLGRAIGLTVEAYVLATVGWMFLIVATLMTDPFGVPLISGSPFYGSVVITLDFCEPCLRGHHLAAILSWTPADALFALTLLAATLASFNRCLGRVAPGLFASRRRARGPVERACCVESRPRPTHQAATL